MGRDRGFLERVKRNRDERRKKIPALLRKGRLELLGLTQAEVAEVLGWAQPEVSKMEAGERTPDVVELEDFALLCGKQIDYFNTWQKQLSEDAVNRRSLAVRKDEFRNRLEAVRRKAANRRFYGRRKVRMTSDEIRAMDEARRNALSKQSLLPEKKS